MDTVPDLVTDRLTLRNITAEDTGRIVRWRSDPEVYRYFLNPHPLSREEHLNWYYNSYVLNPDRLDFMAVTKDEGKAVGLFGIRRPDHESKEAEVSYILAPEEQRKGYAREAITALLSYVKTQWNCQKTIAKIHKDNYDSIRFARKLGYKCICCQEEFEVYEKEL